MDANLELASWQRFSPKSAKLIDVVLHLSKLIWPSVEASLSRGGWFESYRKLDLLFLFRSLIRKVPLIRSLKGYISTSDMKSFLKIENLSLIQVPKQDKRRLALKFVRVTDTTLIHFK